MSTAVPRLHDETYINWCRDSLALLFLKEGLEEFTDKRVSDFHDELHTRVPQPYSRNGPLDPLQQPPSSCIQICKTCTYNEVQRHNHTWRVKCPSKVCSTWLSHIIKHHANNNIERTNLKPQLWPSHPWEVAKCFLPYGCENVTSAKDTDVAAILKLLTTCLFMSKFINDPMLLEQVLDVRNRLMHSRTLSVSDDQLQHDTAKMIGLLNSLEDLSPTETQTIQNAIDSIRQLQSKAMDVTKSKELVALNSRMQGVQKELISLNDKCNDYDKIRLDIKTTADELKVLDKDHSKIQAEIQQLTDAKEKFEEFLQKNDLIHNLGRLSIGLQDLNERCDNQDKRADIQEQILDRHVQLIEQRMDCQDTKLVTLEEQVKSKPDVSVADRCESWDEQCNDLQQYLLDLYSNICLWKNPMTNEEEDILKMYVKPCVKLVREKDIEGWLIEVKEQQSTSKFTYKNIFDSKHGLCKNIYITGDAGAGKTMFCNHVALTWCKEMQNLQEGEKSSRYREVLSSFKFLFYLNLRDTGTTYHIEDMIKEQLMFKTSKSLDVSEILRKEKCLIILDGLDEWLCPVGVQKCPGVHKEIPGRNITNKTCVFLTTTRSWKFDTIDLKTKDIDKHIELCGIGEDASKELGKKISDYLDRKSQTTRLINDFYSEIERKMLDNLITVPVLLIQLMTLWHYGKDFGNSQLQLYCNMLDLFFEHSDKNLPKKSTNLTGTPEANQSIPGCFSTKEHCKNHIDLILCLAKLAYEGLFNSQKEEALVFKHSRIEMFGISPSDINPCLQCGILSQNKDYRNYTGRYSRFSFVHKKIQEFLASLHIVTFDLVDNIIEDLKAFCNSLDIMLEMSQVWMFVAGIRPDITRQILNHLIYVAASDKQVQNYRQTLDGEELIRDILKCVNDCITEGHSNGHTYTIDCLEDFYINKLNIGLVETLLSCTQTAKVKSMFIHTASLYADQLTPITGKLQQCLPLQKLHLHDPACHLPSSFVETLLLNNNNTFVCLDVCYSTISHKFITDVCSSQRLVALGIGMSELTHKNKEHIMNSVLKSTTIRELRLVLPCVKHSWQCRVRIDLSGMTQLQVLGLWCMSVENLHALSRSLKVLRLESVTLQVTDLCEFAREVSDQGKQVRVKLNINLTMSKDRHVDMETFLKTCDGLVVSKCVRGSGDTWSILFQTKSS